MYEYESKNMMKKNDLVSSGIKCR